VQDLLTDAIKTGLGPIGSSIVSIVNASTSATSNSVKYEWKQEDIRATGEERTFTIGSAGGNTKMIQPGKKWKVFQIAGKVGYWNIRSLTLKSCDCDCSSQVQCSPQEDDSCESMTM